jgi:hypothetical protein
MKMDELLVDDSEIDDKELNDGNEFNIRLKHLKQDIPGAILKNIFYGKLGEISTNIKREQELAIVCLHLLQACMAYINTIIFQNILLRSEWKDILMPEDKRALNVLFHSHLNPYGLFPLDLSTRLGITVGGESTILESDQAMESADEEELA